MPWPWLVLLPVRLIQTAGPSPQSLAIDDGEFRATSGHASYDPDQQIALLSGGVVAYYGPTRVDADRLEIHRALAEQFAVAQGHVRLTDPEGTLQADDLRFSWLPSARTGHAENVVAEIGGAVIRADSADITPTLWTFHGLQGTSCRHRIPLYQVRSRLLTVVPGKKGRLEHPLIYILGRRIVDVPTRTFNLDPRVQGIGVPGISYNRDKGLGVAWGGETLLNENTGFSFSASSFHKSLPGYSTGVVRTWVPSEQSRALISPRSDLGERFGYGYFESIEIDRPDREHSYLTAPRNSLGIGSSSNEGAGALGSSLNFSKPLDVVYERGGPIRTLGYFFQLRGEDIREQAGPATNRLLTMASIAPAPLLAGRNLQALLRADSEGFVGSTTYGWLRGTAGLVYSPAPFFRVGGSLIKTVEAGTPFFSIDRPFDRNGLHIRADLNLGPRKISFLVKYGSGSGWFDREFYISQVVGCVEVYELHRQAPNDYRLGLRLRIDQFVEIMQRRKFERTAPTAPVVISGPPTASPAPLPQSAQH